MCVFGSSHKPSALSFRDELMAGNQDFLVQSTFHDSEAVKQPQTITLPCLTVDDL